MFSIVTHVMKPVRDTSLFGERVIPGGDLKKSRGDGRERGRACRQTSVACEQALCLGKKIARKGKFDQWPVHRLNI